ncbi:MAG: type II toxin-antitoxin system RelE/ParE family toxin [Methanosarcinaceae archaeon]|nr:type II toxin-antitoxin system RelE/ParE family toxin [Methanosarcinaceae archaeon]MDF1533396.1 type II toxin-antitoxin system RelE/ParE family toxin [Methanosarcinaceae archaeon]
MFVILLDLPAQKFLKKIDKIIASRIVESIEKLAEEPILHDSKRIIGSKENLFRIRVGKFRVLYRVDYENRHIVITKIDSREHIYN